MNTMKLICMVLSVALVEVPFAWNSHAGMIPTSAAVSDLVRLQNREKVGQFMQRKEVKSELMKFGVNPAEASLRVASMSDAEIQKLAGEIDRAPAGADAIVISLSTVLLVVILLLLLGKI
jgi:hypothetical protein